MDSATLQAIQGQATLTGAPGGSWTNAQAQPVPFGGVQVTGGAYNQTPAPVNSGPAPTMGPLRLNLSNPTSANPVAEQNISYGGQNYSYIPSSWSLGGGTQSLPKSLAESLGGSPFNMPYSTQTMSGNNAGAQQYAQNYGMKPGYLFSGNPASQIPTGVASGNYRPGEKQNFFENAMPLMVGVGGPLAGMGLSALGAGVGAAGIGSDASLAATLSPESGMGAVGAANGFQAGSFAAGQGMGGMFSGALGGLPGPAGATGASLDFNTIGEGAALTNNAAGTAGGVGVYAPPDLTSPASAGLDLGQVGAGQPGNLSGITGAGFGPDPYGTSQALSAGQLANAAGGGGGLGGLFSNLGSDISNVGSNLYNHPLMPLLGLGSLGAKLYQGKQLQDIANRSSQLANPMAQPQRAGAQQNINSFMSGGQDITKTPFIQGGLKLADERTKAQLAMMGMTGSGNAISAYNTNLSNQLNAGIPNYLNTLGMLGGYNQGPGYAGNLYGQYAAGSTATLPMGLASLTQGISQNPGDQSTANQWLLAQIENMNNPRRYGGI